MYTLVMRVEYGRLRYVQSLVHIADQLQNFAKFCLLKTKLLWTVTRYEQWTVARRTIYD